MQVGISKDTYPGLLSLFVLEFSKIRRYEMRGNKWDKITMFSFFPAIYTSVLTSLHLQSHPVNLSDFTLAFQGNYNLTTDCYMLGTTTRLPSKTVVNLRVRRINQHCDSFLRCYILPVYRNSLLLS